MTMPVVALLADGDSCVILCLDSASNRAEVVTRDSHNVPIAMELDQLQAQFIGRVFLLKKQFQYDKRSPEILKTKQGHWFWSTLFRSKHIYRDVLIATILINLFALATPMFTRLVYDKVVPNLAFDTLWVLSSGVLVVFLFDFVLKSLRAYFIDVAGKKSDVFISSKLFEKVLGMRMEARPASTGAFAKHLQEFESIRDFLPRRPFLH